MRVPSVASRAPARGAVATPDLVDVVAPLGWVAAAASLLPWRLHLRVDSDGAELKEQKYFAGGAADGAELAGAHRLAMAAVAVAESELVRSQGRVNGAIGSEKMCTGMNSKQLPGVELNGWDASKRIRSTKLYCESEVERGCARAAKVASEEDSERE